MLEEEARRQEAARLENQQRIKVELDKFNRRTLQMRAREMQDEMAIDMKLLEDLTAAARNEAREALERKVGTIGMWCVIYIKRLCKATTGARSGRVPTVLERSARLQ